MKLVATTAAIVFLSTFSVAAQDVGVPECDDYLKAYERCIATSATADTKQMMLDAVTEQRKNYLELKAQGTAAQVREVCIDNRAEMKATFDAMNCKQ
jgi:hypothetical protein